MSHGDPSERDRVRWDPVYLHARREALEILVAWGIALVWSIGYCSLYGYEQGPPLKMVWGIPSWVFWGVVVPWACAAVFTCYYSLVRMHDDPLGEESLASQGSAPAADDDHGQEH